MGDCLLCGLPDPYDGQGDGIGSCDCPRCEHCGAGPELCDCAREDRCLCGDPDCDPEPDREVVTVTAFAEQGLL